MTDSVYKQAMDAVKTLIQAMDLTGIADDEIKVRKFPWDDTHPPIKGITISWDSQTEGGGTNCRDDIGYPIMITMVQGTGKGWSDDINRIAQWKETIRKRFSNYRLDTVSATDVNSMPCKVHDGKAELPDKYKNNFDVSQLIIVAWFREPRT